MANSLRDKYNYKQMCVLFLTVLFKKGAFTIICIAYFKKPYKQLKGIEPLSAFVKFHEKLIEEVMRKIKVFLNMNFSSKIDSENKYILLILRVSSKLISNSR